MDVTQASQELGMMGGLLLFVVGLVLFIFVVGKAPKAFWNVLILVAILGILFFGIPLLTQSGDVVHVGW